MGVRSSCTVHTKLEQFDQLVAALSITLTDEDRKFLEESYVPHKVLGHS